MNVCVCVCVWLSPRCDVPHDVKKEGESSLQSFGEIMEPMSGGIFVPCDYQHRLAGDSTSLLIAAEGTSQ